MWPQYKLNNLNKIALSAILLGSLFFPPILGDSENLEQLQLIEASRDHTVDPCEDFNGYACGSWAKHHAKEFYTHLGDFLQYNHTIKMMELMLEKYPRESLAGKLQQSAMEKAATYLHSCLKIKTVEVFKYLEEIKPDLDLEWPLLSGVNSTGNWSQFNAFALMGQLHSYGFASDIIEQKTVRQNGNILTVITIPDLNELDTVAVTKLFTELNFTKELASRQVEELRKTHDYWQAAYKDYADFGESENLFSYDDIKQSNPKLNTFLDYVVPQELREEGALVVIPYWDYVEFLLSRQWNAYESQKFCNYLMVKFLLYLKKANGPVCLETSQQRMHLAYDYLYYRQFYLPQVRAINKDISSLTRLTHKHLLSLVYENHLNISAAQIKAIRKMLGLVAINIGNLPERVNSSSLEDHYRLVPDLDISNFYANDLLLMKHYVLESITCPSTMSCSEEINSFPIYLDQQDLLVIPFASLRSPLYQTNLDPLLTLATFGFLIGHELTHTADSSSLKSDAIYDTLFEHILEHPNVNESISCLQQQQSTDFINERIADLVGARVAYRAYSREYNLQPNFTVLPWRQLFFLNLAQVFCTKPEGAYVDGKDSFATRLNHIALNMEAFAEAFHCPVGSKMNPAKKCRFY